MNFYQYYEYKSIVRDYLKTPLMKKRRKNWSALGKFLNVNSSNLSRIFSGERDLSLDQAYGVCDFFSWEEMESDYFLFLVMRSRAQSESFRKKIDKKLDRLRYEMEKQQTEYSLEKGGAQVSDTAKLQLFSDWTTLAVAMLTDIPGHQNPNKIAQRLSLTESRVQTILKTLVETKVCTQNPDGTYRYLGSSFLEKNSPIMAAYLTQWRLRSISGLSSRNERDIHTSSVASVSTQDYERIRSEIQQFRKRFIEIAKESKPEMLICLNLDWFEV